MAREFAQREIAPRAAELDAESKFDDTLVEKLGALGFLGMLIPESHGGLGLDSLSYLLALEEIAQADASAAVLLSVHNSLPTQMLLHFGSDAQKTQFLAPMAQG